MRAFSRFALALFFVVAGIAHLLMPAPYLAIMPSFIPWPQAMVALSGLLEIFGGLAVCFRQTRLVAGWGLIALLIAVFPANIHALASGMVIAGHVVPGWVLWARLPFQMAFIVWVYCTCLRGRPNEHSTT